MSSSSDSDTIRILVATDNHVGFEERDPIRKDDSWRTFDEIMQLARKHDVDMVLLGGDLFHENKPSRKAMYQVMRSLRKNCLGMKPCELEFLSDASEVFEGAFAHVNYQDPDINISIPVFSIHGNHDDPSGDGHYCTLDLLQVAGLVNYFGRIPEADNIHVRPILLQKGNTKLALYGLSNVRDERMHRTFRDNKVKFYRPNQQKSDWFNLIAVHQNHYAHTATGYLPENMLPDFMDLVIWGHEHECLLDPVKNDETGFRVMQPGSSVATSLVPGEAVTKQVGILSITGRDFQLEKIPLKTVRPFVTREIHLGTDKRFKGVAKMKDNRQEVTKRLMEIVEEMIEEANADWLSIQDADDLTEVEQEQPLPLIRLKVEYTGAEGEEFEVENPQRFSNRFVNKVANTNDVVYFYRKKTGVTKRGKGATDASANVADAHEGMDTIKVEALVHQFLEAEALKILPQAPFGDAVTQFINKDDKHAMETFVIDSLATQVKDLLAFDDDHLDLNEAMLKIKAMAEAQFATGMRKQAQRRRLRDKPDNWDSDLDGHWADQDNAFEVDPSPLPNARTASRGKRVAATEERDEGGAMDVDEAESPPPRATAKRGVAAKESSTRATKSAATKKAAPPKKAPPRSRKKTADPFIDSDEEDDVVMASETEDPPVKKRGTSPKRSQPTRTSTRTRQTTISFAQSQKPTGKSTQNALEISDDEISEDDAFESMPTTRATTRRKR